MPNPRDIGGWCHGGCIEFADRRGAPQYYSRPRHASALPALHGVAPGSVEPLGQHGAVAWPPQAVHAYSIAGQPDDGRSWRCRGRS